LVNVTRRPLAPCLQQRINVVVPLQEKLFRN
jgi:hypothetical protein